MRPLALLLPLALLAACGTPSDESAPAEKAAAPQSPIERMVAAGDIRPFGPVDVEKWKAAGAKFQIAETNMQWQEEVMAMPQPQQALELEGMRRQYEFMKEPRAGYLVVRPGVSLPAGFRPGATSSFVYTRETAPDTSGMVRRPNEPLPFLYLVDADPAALTTTGNPMFDPS